MPDGPVASRGPERRPLLCFPGRARRGTSGALYLQSAPAGLNSLPRSPCPRPPTRATLRTGSRAAATREPRQVRKEAALSAARRVPRTGLVRAGRRRWARERSVDGGCTAHDLPRDTPSSTESVVTRDRRAPGPLPALARPDLRPDRRPGAVVETLRNAVRLAGRPRLLFVGPRGTGKTSMARIIAKAVNCTDLAGRRARATPAPLRRDPRGPRPRRHRAGRRVEQPGRRHARAPAARLHGAVRPAPQGLHHRRGPAHQGGLGRPAQDPRGAARRRPLHLLHDRPEPGSARPSSRGSSASPSGRCRRPRSRASCGASSRPRAGGRADAID